MPPFDRRTSVESLNIVGDRRDLSIRQAMGDLTHDAAKGLVGHALPLAIGGELRLHIIRGLAAQVRIARERVARAGR